uniref:SAM domain-containing protein n=1 Tax=Myripristis murdjan TaxID=586833 RepID=A0A667X5Y1_9TELE
MLNSLTRRDLERHLNITKKFHQALQNRRMQCEHQNVDPLVWTSHRVIRWIRDIDLKEYADSLQNSGVHGAVMVLDPTFNTDTMATALGIPSSKHMIRRHLVEEMKTLIGPARATAKQEYERLGLGTPPTLLRQSSLGRTPSSAGRHTDDEGSLRRRAVKVGKHDDQAKFKSQKLFSGLNGSLFSNIRIRSDLILHLFTNHYTRNWNRSITAGTLHDMYATLYLTHTYMMHMVQTTHTGHSM